MNFCEYLYQKGKLEEKELQEIREKEEKPGKQLLRQHKFSPRQLTEFFSQYLREKETH